MVLRDHEGSFVFSACRQTFSCNDALESELLALQEVIALALQWCSLPLDIESDCLEAVMMIKSSVSNKSKYAFW